VADIWWHVARTPDGVWVDELGPASDDLPGRVGAIQAELGFPDDWVAVPGWDSRLAPGEPHPSLLDGATVRRLPPADEGARGGDH
jgi:hypothetical protein